jgi:hypothetical protein
MSTSEDALGSTPNRLTIAHLLLWTLGSAIILAMYRVLATDEEQTNGQTLVPSVYAIAFSVLMGAQLGSVFLFASRLIRGAGGFPTQPGHWLLLIEGVSVLLAGSGQIAVRLGSRTLDLWAFSQIPNCVVTAVLYAVAIRVQSGAGTAWKAALILLSVQHAAAALVFGAFLMSALSRPSYPWGWGSEMYRLQTGCFPPIIALVLVMSAMTDMQARQRDLLHWAGVASLVGTSFMQASFPFLAKYLAN